MAREKDKIQGPDKILYKTMLEYRKSNAINTSWATGDIRGMDDGKPQTLESWAISRPCRHLAGKRRNSSRIGWVRRLELLPDVKLGMKDISAKQSIVLDYL